MLILRDCFLGLSKFEQLQKSLGVTRHVLAGRLKRLVDMGVLEKRAYQTRPLRYDYVLTQKGRDLGPAMTCLRDWGREHMALRRQVGKGKTL